MYTSLPTTDLLIVAGFVLVLTGFILNLMQSRKIEDLKRNLDVDARLIENLQSALKRRADDNEELHARHTLAIRYAAMDDEHHWREFEATKIRFGLDPSYQYCITSVRSMNLSRALAEAKK